MADEMSVQGEFRIDPPLKWPEIKNHGLLSQEDGGTRITDIVLQVAATETDTDEGVHTVVTCARVVPWRGSVYDAENLLANVEELRAECAGHTVTGEMVLYSRDYPGYVMRVVSDADGVRKEAARLVWPDGSEAKPLW